MFFWRAGPVIEIRQAFLAVCRHLNPLCPALKQLRILVRFRGTFRYGSSWKNPVKSLWRSHSHSHLQIADADAGAHWLSVKPNNITWGSTVGFVSFHIASFILLSHVLLLRHVFLVLQVSYLSRVSRFACCFLFLRVVFSLTFVIFHLARAFQWNEMRWDDTRTHATRVFGVLCRARPRRNRVQVGRRFFSEWARTQ